MTLGGYLSYRYNTALKDNRDLVVHTHKVISAIERALSDIQDAETGQRGFIITGEETYLAPYEHALQTIPNSLREVRSLVLDRSEQLVRLDALEIVVSKKLDELSATILLRSESGFEAARAAVVKAAGKESMDRIRFLAAQMSSVETDLLAERTSVVARNEQTILWLALFFAVASVATRVLVAFASARAERHESVATDLDPGKGATSAV
ncbi:CHASE3 domain-containing protein [Methylocystis sp. MJC1]|uniref:CHASE3 domain-containing protein n=1 Tax=Methylocystis sp. MJC1 TaxID=2654282 RepID=UPI0013EAFE3D|nr:CHASE3 domain-containing protein [Methylocystis sp. MJC1]